MYHLIDSVNDIKYESRVGVNQVMGIYRHFMATGRVAMFNPNLLGIDKDETIEIEDERYLLSLRKAFTAREGYILVTADYCQIELRILATLSQEENLIRVFDQNNDPFKMIATRIYRKDFNQITSDERNAAKQVSFG